MLTQGHPALDVLVFNWAWGAGPQLDTSSRGSGLGSDAGVTAEGLFPVYHTGKATTGHRLISRKRDQWLGGEVHKNLRSGVINPRLLGTLAPGGMRIRRPARKISHQF